MDARVPHIHDKYFVGLSRIAAPKLQKNWNVIHVSRIQEFDGKSIQKFLFKNQIDLAV